MARMVVLYDMQTCDMYSIIKDKRYRFADLNEARATAERKDFDGIKIKVVRGYGLKPRIDRLNGKTKKGVTE